MDEMFGGNGVHLKVSFVEQEKAKFRTRSLPEKKVCVFLFLNCLRPPDQLLPAGFSRRPGGGGEEKGRKREQKVATK